MTENDTPEAVVLERTVDAPVELVWELWTRPEHFSAWYGPTGATIQVAEMDLRVGGMRLVCMEMTTPDGPMQMWFAGEYREITPARRLVYTEFVADADGRPLDASDAGPHGPSGTTEVVVELEGLGERTRIRLTHVGIPADSPGATGWAMALDELVAYAGRT